MSELHEYPFTSYEGGCNMGCFMGLCHKAGVKLAVVGDSLQLLDRNNFVLSQVKIQIAQAALKDELGNDITAYIINAGTREDTVVLTKGNGDEIVITVPYATKATKDSENQDIVSYLRNLTVSGDKLRATRGDGSAFEITVPYATKAFTDVNDKPLTTYGASLEVAGNNVILKDGMGTIIDTITVHYAERAAADQNGNNIMEEYGAVLQAGTTTIKLISKSGDILNEITVPYSTMSLQDTNGNAFLHDYAETLVVDNDGKRLDLLAHDGTLLSAVTVPFSTLATDATNAIERAEIVGDQLVLTTYGGVITRLTIPYAIRALNDNDSNEITKTYVHNVVQDPVTGEITFYDAEGTALCALTPRARIAEYDTYNNLIADYIKTLVFDNQSDYLVATHGDGTTDTIVVNYSNKAWKDTQGNIIKNTYIAFVTNVTDNEGEWVMIFYNGSGAELFRLKVVANKAQKDQLGNVIDTFYAHGISINNYSLSLTDAHGTVLGSVTLPKDGTHIEYEQNPYNIREYYMNLQNVDDQNLDSKMMYFDTDGYDIMFGQINPDWKELSRISTPMDARTIEFENNNVTPNEFHLKLKDADDNETDNHWMSAYIDGNTGDLVLYDIGNAADVFRVALPSHNLRLQKGMPQYYNGVAGIITPNIYYVVDENNKCICRLYIIDSFEFHNIRMVVWSATTAANSFDENSASAPSLTPYIPGPGKIVTTNIAGDGSLMSDIESILTNVDNGNYGTNYYCMFIPYDHHVNNSWGTRKGMMFNRSSNAMTIVANGVKSQFNMKSDSWFSYNIATDYGYYITDVRGSAGNYSYTTPLSMDLIGYDGGIDTIGCRYYNVNGSESYTTISNPTITTNTNSTNISIPQVAPGMDPNTFEPTNYPCSLEFYKNGGLIFKTEIFTPAGQII